MCKRLDMGGGGQKRRVDWREETAARALAASDEIRSVKIPSLWLNIFHSDLDLRPLLPSRMQIPINPVYNPHARRPKAHVLISRSSLRSLSGSYRICTVVRILLPGLYFKIPMTTPILINLTL